MQPNSQVMIAQRLALSAIQQTDAFKSISASILDLGNPLVEIVGASIGVVVFDLRPSDVDQLYLSGTSACPFVMFHVDLRTGEVVSAKRATPSPRTELLHVHDLLVDRKYTLKVPADVVAAFWQGEVDFRARRGELIRVEPKRPCEPDLEGPYYHCYDV